MPAAQIYVMAVVGTVAAAVFFKEFVYEPHIAPNVERWAEQFIAHRQARRTRRQREAPLPASQNVPAPNNTLRRPNGDIDRQTSRRSSIELENLVAREVDEWRTKVNRSQTSLRQRKHPLLDVSNVSIPYGTISPTHVIFDPSSPPTPTSEGGRSAARSVSASHKLERSSSATLRSPSIPSESTRLPSPDPSLRPLSPGILNDASIIASYEVAQASDSSRSDIDLESVSGTPFSSRPQSPLSAFSAVGAPSHQGIIFEAPTSEMDFLSDSGSGSFILHSTPNLSAGGSVNSDGFDVQSSRWDASSASSWASAVEHST